MPRRDPPNPYMGLRLAALGDHLMQRAEDLLEGRKATRRDIAYLLIAAGHAVLPSRGRPGLPPERIADGLATPQDVFWPVYEAELESLRWMVARQAMDAAWWPDGSERDRLAAEARASDEALRLVLARVGEALRQRRRLVRQQRRAPGGAGSPAEGP